ncbi:MAG: hypothetical protein HLUCCO16_03190 [Phormidium sp. OSCR]|nr:MAG: hypothetical protein HLUCCO16_03190 [Phormidium sp. OSCR]
MVELLMGTGVYGLQYIVSVAQIFYVLLGESFGGFWYARGCVFLSMGVRIMGSRANEPRKLHSVRVPEGRPRNYR